MGRSVPGPSGRSLPGHTLGPDFVSGPRSSRRALRFIRAPARLGSPPGALRPLPPGPSRSGCRGQRVARFGIVREARQLAAIVLPRAPRIPELPPGLSDAQLEPAHRGVARALALESGTRIARPALA